MFRKSVVTLMTALVAACFAGTASADVVCADSSYCEVVFAATFSGSYQTGLDYNNVTINPDGSGDTFTTPFVGWPGPGPAIDIRVYARNCQGDPLEGIPLTEIQLFNSALCICPGGNTADAATDVNGCTTFTGSIAGGGCASSLDVYVDGVFICTIPVSVNSADFAGGNANCATDAGDAADLSPYIGSDITGNTGPPPTNQTYDICRDYIENGFIDAGDVAFLASKLGTACL